MIYCPNCGALAGAGEPRVECKGTLSARDATAVQLGYVIGLVSVLDLDALEALAVDARCHYREVAQTVIDLRAQILGGASLQQQLQADLDLLEIKKGVPTAGKGRLC